MTETRRDCAEGMNKMAPGKAAVNALSGELPGPFAEHFLKHAPGFGALQQAVRVPV